MALIQRGKIWHVRAQVGGILIAKSTKTANRRMAEQMEKKWVSEAHEEAVIKGRKPVTVQEGITAFLKSRQGSKGHISAVTKMRLWQPLAAKPLHAVTDQDLQDLIQDALQEGYSVNTVNVSIVYWNALQNFAGQAGYTPGVKLKRLKGGGSRIRFLTEAEEVKLLAELNPDNGHFREKRKAQDNLDFVTLLLHTGARDQEIASLQLSQIDQAAGTLTIHRSKGGTDTTLKMSKAVTQIVARRMVAAEEPWPEGRSMHGRVADGFLFPERAKGRYNTEWLTRACERAGLQDVSLHTMRHTFATRMLKAGLSIVEVQHLLGHKNLSSTMVYAHFVPNTTADRAAAVLDA